MDLWMKRNFIHLIFFSAYEFYQPDTESATLSDTFC